MDPYRVSLTLLDISSQVQEDDDKGTTIIRLVKEQVLDRPCPARKFLNNKSPSQKDIETIQQQVLKFLRVRDKWTALASVLCKSQAFHRVRSSSTTRTTRKRRKAIVDLPRTKYRKPYIPIHSITKDEEDEVTVHPLSISHQYPFIGGALLHYASERNPNFRPKLGLDVVIFETYNTRLYDNQEEFLDVFRTSFTGREWNCIKQQVNEEESLREFYLRWAMKEAYTKALGVGLGFEFNTFDISLVSVDDDDGGMGSVWQNLCSLDRSNEGVYFSGSIKFLIPSDRPSENWDFFFLPLHEKQDTFNQIETASGAACVCMGPFPSSLDQPTPSSHFRIDLQWTDLDALIEWHHL